MEGYLVAGIFVGLVLIVLLGCIIKGDDVGKL